MELGRVVLWVVGGGWLRLVAFNVGGGGVGPIACVIWLQFSVLFLDLVGVILDLALAIFFVMSQVSIILF